MREKFVEGYEAINVSLNSITLKIGKLIWDAYKMTWVKYQEIEYDPTNEIIKKACFDVINNKALPTPKESIKFNFKIENVSRVCLAQITRGRIGWWFNVESQMPQYLNHGVTIPLNIAKSKFDARVKDMIIETQKLYEEMAKEGFPPQDLRYLCMHGQQTSMVADCNFAALPGFFMMRAENGLTDELNLVARMMKREIYNKVYDAYYNNFLDVLEYDLWNTMLSKLDCLGSKQKLCMITDKVLGNTGRFPSANDDVASPEGKIKPDFDFKKSAWFLELKRLNKNLLFPGEEEMIKTWNNGK